MRFAYNNLLSILLLSGLLCPLVLFGQDSLNVRMIEQVKLWYAPVGVVFNGTTMAMATAGTTGIVLFDAAEPLRPVELSRLLIGPSSGRMRVHSDKLIYNGTEPLALTRLRITDISNPTLPEHLGNASNSTYDFDIWGDSLLYIEYSPGTRAVRMLDLTNDIDFDNSETLWTNRLTFVRGFWEYIAVHAFNENSLELHKRNAFGTYELQFTVPFSSEVIDVKQYGEFQLVLCRHHLNLVSRSDSGATIEWSQYIPNLCRSFEIEQNRIFVNYDRAGLGPSMTVFGLTALFEPDSLTSIRIVGSGYYFDFVDTLMFLPVNWYSTRTGLTIYNVANADTVQEIASFDSPGPALTLARLDTLIYAGRGSQISGIWDISNPLLIKHAGYGLNNNFETAIWDSFALVAEGDHYYCTYGLTDPAHPNIMSCSELEGWPTCTGPQIIGGTNGLFGKNRFGHSRSLYLSDIRNFEVYDSIIVVSAANGVYILENVDWQTLGFAALPSLDVRLRDNVIYSAVNVSGLQVIKIDDVSNPQLWQHIPIEGETQELELEENILMTCSRSGGLRLWDVSVADTPLLIGWYNSGYSTEDVILVDTVAYVAENYRLTVLNCADAIAMAGPPAPRDLTIAMDDNGLSFQWRRSPRATHYTLWSRAESDQPEEFGILEVATADTFATLPVPQLAARYYFVKAER